MSTRIAGDAGFRGVWFTLDMHLVLLLFNTLCRSFCRNGFLENAFLERSSYVVENASSSDLFAEMDFWKDPHMWMVLIKIRAGAFRTRVSKLLQGN